jgi:glycerol uptake facilitator-like aquaporin
MTRRLTAEFLGTALLLVAVVGSGIMAERLAGGNMAVALLANALATGAALVVLITIFAPLSGAHFNPAVSFYFALRGEMPWSIALRYLLVQIIAAIIGVWLAHLMFNMPVLETSSKLREGPALWLAEFIGGPLHHGRLLVHRFNVFRQSRRHHCPVHDGQFLRDCSGIRARIHCRTTGSGGDRCIRTEVAFR